VCYESTATVSQSGLKVGLENKENGFNNGKPILENDLPVPVTARICGPFDMAVTKYASQKIYLCTKSDDNLSCCPLLILKGTSENQNTVAHKLIMAEGYRV